MSHENTGPSGSCVLSAPEENVQMQGQVAKGFVSTPDVVWLFSNKQRNRHWQQSLRGEGSAFRVFSPGKQNQEKLWRIRSSLDRIEE